MAQKDPRSLSPDAQEELRRRVLEAIQSQGMKKAHAARTSGVSWQAVNNWLAAEGKNDSREAPGEGRESHPGRLPGSAETPVRPLEGRAARRQHRQRGGADRLIPVQGNPGVPRHHGSFRHRLFVLAVHIADRPGAGSPESINSKFRASDVRGGEEPSRSESRTWADLVQGDLVQRDDLRRGLLDGRNRRGSAP